MHRYAFLLLIAFTLFSGTSCPGECEYFNRGLAKLEITLENPAERYSVGETLWLHADFPATIGQGNNSVTIGTGGGLVVSQFYRLQTDSSVITAGLDAFTPRQEEGMIIENGPEDDLSAALLRYTCENGDCTFRQGFRIDSAGTFLLQVSGSSFEQTNGPFQFCGEPGFGQTELVGGNNLQGVPLAYPLIYEDAQQSFFTQFGIDTFGQQNLFLIRVE